MINTLGNEAGAHQLQIDTVDFTRSIPPTPPILESHLVETLRRISARADTGILFRNALAGGSMDDRQVAAVWLRSRFGEALSPKRIAVTNGTQSAVLLLLEGLVGQGGLLLTECLSYGVIGDLARRAHVRITGLPIDDEGIVPEAFEAACRHERPGALYCNPTDHNPTTAVASEERRLALAAIARRYGVPIIEDDPVGRLHPAAPAPISAVAPDVTWYVSGVTKCLGHGVRIAYLVAPTGTALDSVIAPARRLSHWFPAPLMTALIGDWIRSGAADAITAAIRGESEARRQIALAILSGGQGHDRTMKDMRLDESTAFHHQRKPQISSGIMEGVEFRCNPDGLHGWLRLPAQIEADDFTDKLAGSGVLVRSARMFAIGGMPIPNAIRLALCSPPDRAAVEAGLAQIASLLRRDSDEEDRRPGPHANFPSVA